MFTDSHRPNSATYMQLPDVNPENNPAEQIKMMEQIFANPAQLSKIVKDLGQTDDEPVNGQDCYTLTAKVFGQKVKIWVDKSTCLISQSQITLGGAISDADIDDAFSFFAAAGFGTPMQLNVIKPQVKRFAPVLTKIRGTITSTTEDIEINPTFTTDDFNYDVPPDVKLIQMPNSNRPPRTN